MALELEELIMREIGLGQHYSWHNGSGSCGYQAKHSAGLLKEVIKRHHDAAEAIAEPDTKLCALALEVANTEEDPYTLTRTWQVCSEVIAAHIYAAHDGADVLASTSSHINQRYLGRSEWMQGWDGKLRKVLKWV